MVNISNFNKNLANIPGWNTRRRIVVFESDDWGSIRTSSIAAVERLCAKGIDFTSLDARRYSYNDTLASVEDLSALFDVLTSVKDCNNHAAIFTAMSLVANPDFEKIKNSGFKDYYYEPFTETLKRYHGCEDSFELWKHGLDEGIFIPQFHGREHLNVIAWMNALKCGHAETIDVFNEGMFGYVNTFINGRRINYQEAFNIYDVKEIPFLEKVLESGLKLFEELFGYRAKVFVAPNGPFPNVLEKTLSSNGIIFITQSKIQNEALGNGKTRKVLHFIGMKNRFGQIYLTRNCFFEPGSFEKKDWIKTCLHEIELAFRWHKPAIISSHRVNYIGSLNVSNRHNNLEKLRGLLIEIKNRWPEVEFMSSDQLGSVILNRSNE